MGQEMEMGKEQCTTEREREEKDDLERRRKDEKDKTDGG